MKKLIAFLFCTVAIVFTVVAQDKRPPAAELKAQKNHVASSGNDLLHLRFKKAHEKHVAEMKRRNSGIAKDLRGEGKPLPKPKAPAIKPPVRP